MANKQVTLKRVIDTSGNTDTIHPTTDWAQIESKPTTFTPTSHDHTLSEITDAGTVAAIDTNASTTQFLRGDGTWATPADSNTTYTAGSGLSLTGTTFANTAPDQTVTLTGSGATTVTGTYPNFTISSTDTNTVYSHPTHPGDDINVDTGALTGAWVISDLDFNITSDTLGHITDANGAVATRQLTATDIGLGNVTNESKATMFTSPTFTGTPTAPTASTSVNNTQIATTAYVTNKLAGIGGGLNFEGTIDLSVIGGANGDDLATAGLTAPGDYLIVSATGAINNDGSPLVTLAVQAPGDEGDSTLPVTLETGDWIVYVSGSGTTMTVSIINNTDTRFAASTHTHSASDINSGTLGVARGGTGATSFTSGNVLIGAGTGAVTTLSRSGIDSRSTFPPSSHTHDDRYYTESEADSRFLNTAGDTATGKITFNGGLEVLSGTGGGAFRIKRNSTSTTGDDITDLHMDDGSTYFDIDNDLDGDGGNFIFRRKASGAFAEPTMYANTSRMFTDGYHPNADKWTTARTLSLSGDASGSVSWDGSANATLSVTVNDDSHNHTIANVDGLQTALDGKAASSHTHTIGYYSSSATSNLNTLYSTGQFGWANTATGRPEDYGQGINIVSVGTAHNNSNNWITQLAFGTAGNTGYFRTKVNANGWGSWYTLIHSGNIGSQSVSYAASAPWSGITGKPSTFTPSSHTHTPSQVGLGNVSNAAQVTTTYNSSLNSDSRNSRGVTRLYRRDSDSDYSIQHYWTGSHWFLRGYSADNFHAEVRVGYADSAGNADTVDGLHASSFWQKSGSWLGDLGSNGYTREIGLAMTGGSEFVVLSKSGQGSVLVDGHYLSYESNNGFFGSFNSQYGNLTGIQATAANTLTVKQLDGGGADLEVTGQVRWESSGSGGYSGNPRAAVIGYSGGNYGNIGYGWVPTSTSGNYTSAIADLQSRVMLYDGIVVYGSGSAVSVGSTVNFQEVLDARTSRFAYKGNTVWHAGNDGAGSGLDADNLDGYTWTSSGKNIRGTEIYADNWFRNYNSGEGLYNEATGMHWYSTANNQFSIYSSQSSTNIRFMTSGGTVRGYVHADNGSNVGFLHSGGAWSLRTDSSRNTEMYGGLTISGSIDTGGTDYGYYQSAGTNIWLKGDGLGRSGIFFESEKNGTNINHPSDYGFIQFHSYGYGGSSGESNRLVIGVANDSTDQIVLQAPYSDGVKIGYRNATSGTGLTLSTVWHTGNLSFSLSSNTLTITTS